MGCFLFQAPPEEAVPQETTKSERPQMTQDRGLGFRVGVMLGLSWGYIKVMLGLYGDNGKENGNYYNEFGC